MILNKFIKLFYVQNVSLDTYPIHNTSLFPNVILPLVSTSLLRVTSWRFKRTLFLNMMSYAVVNFIIDLG